MCLEKCTVASSRLLPARSGHRRFAGFIPVLDLHSNRTAQMWLVNAPAGLCIWCNGWYESCINIGIVCGFPSGALFTPRYCSDRGHLSLRLRTRDATHSGRRDVPARHRGPARHHAPEAEHYSVHISMQRCLSHKYGACHGWLACAHQARVQWSEWMHDSCSHMRGGAPVYSMGIRACVHMASCGQAKMIMWGHVCAHVRRQTWQTAHESSKACAGSLGSPETGRSPCACRLPSSHKLSFRLESAHFPAMPSRTYNAAARSPLFHVRVCSRPDRRIARVCPYRSLYARPRADISV